MKLTLGERERMVLEALRGYPYEVCGVFLGRGAAVARAVGVKNREEESPRVRYQIAPADLLRLQREARKEDLEIIGYYHSHPDHPARPSETDRRVAAEGLSDGVFHVVIGVNNGRDATPTAWVYRERLKGFEEEPLEIE